RVSGVARDLAGDFLNLVAELQADAIAPRWHQWPQGERVPALLLRRVDLDRRGRHMPAVPHEPVKALPPRRPRFLWTPGLGLLVLVPRRRTEAPDLLARGVQAPPPQL